MQARTRKDTSVFCFNKILLRKLSTDKINSLGKKSFQLKSTHKINIKIGLLYNTN